MAKKANKKAAKSAKKKPTAKKVAKKKPVAKKKSAPKKVAKKKPVAKSKPTAKKVAKKKPVAKAKPASKKATKKKPVAKAKATPKKVVVVKEAVKPKAKIKEVKAVIPVEKKPVGRPQKKKTEQQTIDDEDRLEEVAKKTSTERSKSNDEFFSSFEYKPMVKKPANQPKPHISKDKRTRFTDKELAEFKAIIDKKLAEAIHDYEMLKNSLSHKDDHGTDDTSPTFKLLEDGSDVLSKEETAHLAARQEKYIQNLKNALIRIENKSYGICRATGRLISKERLRSVPHATLDIDAKLEQTY